MTHLTFLEAGVVGLIQGVSELFPVSSLGHNVLLPALAGGSWAKDLNVAAPESPYLAVIVGLHVATAIALLIYFWRDWIRIIGGFFGSVAGFARSLRRLYAAPRGARRWQFSLSPDGRLAWMIVLATIPVGVVGLAFEHEFRVIFGKPIYAAVFLVVNGVILIAGERLRRRASVAADQKVAAERELAVTGAVRVTSSARAGGAARVGGAARAGGGKHAAGHQVARNAEIARAEASDRRLSMIGLMEAVVIGSAQILALLAGISRDGVAMVAGMFRGLSREDAARFAFLLATPVILAAGLLKVPDLMGPLGDGIRGQVLFGSVLSGAGAYLSVRFLVRYFQTRTLTPFGIYCLVVGFASLGYLGLIK